jgi:3D-(3,5/4)-trihydroxycyclohexane-1,2-dione acylhydrolase (decyclizing)
VANPVLQELEDPRSYDISVNDAFRPVSRFFDRVWRPEQLPSALLGAMRVLADPAETGAVTIALPQDVQAEAYDWPEELFAPRVWHIPRPVPEPAALARAVELVRSAERPLVVAGGGVHYSEATDALRRFAEATGIPVGDTQAGKGSLLWDHPQAVGGVGSTGSPVANALARDADVVIGIGTRWSDFTTASRTAFQNPGVRFVNLNVAAFDAAKHAGEMLVADARAGLEALTEALDGYRASSTWDVSAWNRTVDEAFHLGHQPLPAQTEVLGALNEEMDATDVVVQAAGSMPGDLQMLWRARDAKQYHVEYAYSCMGYEIAGALGIKMAAPEREVFALVGDGSYLMMASEIVTAVSEGIKLNLVIVQNHGFASIGALSESVGSQRFGTSYRYRNPDTGLLDGRTLPVDLAANAESLGAEVIRVRTIEEFREAIARSRASDRTTAIHIETDPLAPAPDSENWWDVPVAEVSQLDSTTAARKTYEAHKSDQRPLIGGNPR